MASKPFDIVMFIDDHFVIVGVIGAIVFGAVTYLIYKLTLQAHFEEKFPKEKLQLLANFDPKKKEKKQVQKPTKKKGKGKNGSNNTDSGETGDENAVTAAVIEPLASAVSKVSDQAAIAASKVSEKASAATSKVSEQASAVASKVTEQAAVVASKISKEAPAFASTIAEKASSAASKVTEQVPIVVSKLSEQSSVVAAKVSELTSSSEAETKPNKKKTKAKKTELEATKKERATSESVENFVEKKEVNVNAAENIQTNALKNRKKRAPQIPQEVITDLDEDKFITRIASIAELQPEYLSFITDFLNQVHTERFEFGSVRDEVSTLNTKLREVEKAVQNKDGEVSKLRSELTKTQRSAIESRMQHDKLAEQLQAAQKALYEARQPKPNKELEDLRKEFSDLKARYHAAVDQAKEADKLKAQLAEAKIALAKPDTKLQDQIKELQEKINKSQQDAVRANEIIERLTSDNQNLRDREKQIGADIDALSREIEALQHYRIEKENIAQAPDNSEELNKLKQELHELEQKNEMSNGAITKLNIELRKAYHETMEYKKERDDMKKAFDSLVTERDDLAKQVEASEKQRLELQESFEGISSKMREVKNEFESAQLEKDNLKIQLIEERDRVDKLEDELSKAGTNQADENKRIGELQEELTKANTTQTADRKRIEQLEKELEATRASASTSDSEFVKKLENEIQTLKSKKEELYDLNMRNAEKVRAAEDQASKVLKEVDEFHQKQADTFKQIVGALTASLKSADVKISDATPSNHEEFFEWVQGLPGAIKKVFSEQKSAFEIPGVKSETTKKEHSPTNDAEIKKLKAEVKKYQNSIDILVKQLHAIEAAYEESEAEYKAEINDLRKSVQSSKSPTLASPGSLATSSTADSAEWELVQ